VNDEIADVCAECRLPIDHGVALEEIGDDGQPIQREERDQSAEARRIEVLWDSLRQGDWRPGTVRTVAADSVTVDLGGIDGTLPVSEVQPETLAKLAPGDRVEVLVTGVARHRGRVYLAMPSRDEAAPSAAAEVAASLDGGAQATASRADNSLHMDVRPGTEFSYTVTDEITARSVAELGTFLFDHPDVAREHMASGVLVYALASYDQALALQIDQTIRRLSGQAYAPAIIAYLLNPRLPFRLADIGLANGPKELARLIDRDSRSWAAGREAIYDGSITSWMDAIGAGAITKAWAEVLRHFLTPETRDAGTEHFLHLLDPTLPRPTLEVSNSALAFTVSHSSLVAAQTVTLRNGGRGYLAGPLEAADPPPWLAISATSFAGPATEITLTVDGTAFRAGERHVHRLEVTSNAGRTQTILVTAGLRLAASDVVWSIVVGGLVGGVVAGIARMILGAALGVGDAFLGTRYAQSWTLPDFILHLPPIPEPVAWAILGAIIGAACGLAFSPGGRRSPRLRWISVLVPVAVVGLLGIVTHPLASAAAQGRLLEASFASALPGRWIGSTDGAPVGLDLTVSGDQVRGTALFPAGVEQVAGTLGPSESVTLAGSEYMSIAWVGGLSLGRIELALAGPGQVSGAVSSSTLQGALQMHKVLRPDLLTGGWIGSVGGQPAVLLVGSTTSSSVSALVAYGGVKETLAGRTQGSRTANLQGTAYTNVTSTSGWAMDDFLGVSISPGTATISGYMASGSKNFPWHFSRMRLTMPTEVPVAGPGVALGLSIPAGQVVRTPQLPWDNAQVQVTSTQACQLQTTGQPLDVPAGGPTSWNFVWHGPTHELIFHSTGAPVDEVDIVLTRH
jgi:hypothetical protein